MGINNRSNDSDNSMDNSIDNSIDSSMDNSMDSSMDNSIDNSIISGTVMAAREEDSEEILALYRSMLYGPADWNEQYPNEDTIKFDLSRNALYVMKNPEGEIIATISIDLDMEVEGLGCWNPKLAPGAELSRLGVRKDMRNKGIAKQMMHYVFDILRKQGKRSVHILVKTGHKAALKAYSDIGYRLVGECTLFGKEFVCMEIEL